MNREKNTHTPTPSFSPRLLIAIAMAIFGTIGLVVRRIPLPSAEIALYRAVLAVAAIGLYLLLTRQKIKIAGMKKELVLLVISGVAMGFNWILLFEAYKYTTVSMATLSYYAAPVLITLVSTILFREKLTPRKVLCFVMSTVGILLITVSGSAADAASAGAGSSASGGIRSLVGGVFGGIRSLVGGVSGGSTAGTHHIGILFGLGAAVLYATVVLLNKLIRNVAGIQRTFLQFVAAVVTLFPYVLLTGGTHLGALDASGWGFLLLIGLLHTGVAYCMYFSSLAHVSGQEAAVLSYIDPLVAVILSVLVLHEPMSALQLLGGAMILGFTLLNELPE